MKLIHHFIICVFLSIILFPFFGLDSLYVFVGGFLIDIDHLIFYWHYYKKINIRECYNFFSSNRIDECRGKVFLFHTIEFFILLIILSFFNKIFLIMLAGFIVHMAMDFKDEYGRFKQTKEISIVYTLLKKK